MNDQSVDYKNVSEAILSYTLNKMEKIILLNKYQCMSTCLTFSFPQFKPLTLIAFFMPLFRIWAQTSWSMNMTNPTSCLGEEPHRSQVPCICAVRRLKNSQLGAELNTFMYRIRASCRSPGCSGCSWPPPSLVGMLPSMGARVQGERPAHRHAELRRDLGRKGVGKSKRLMVSVWVVYI